METARLLEAEGRRPVHVFAGGKLLSGAEATRGGLEQVRAMTDGDIVRWLVDNTGSAELAGLTDEQQGFLARVFRHDTATANGYLLAAAERPEGAALTAPFTAVYAADDSLTEDRADRHNGWGLFFERPRAAELGTGGHYFCRTVPNAVAELVLATWRETPAEA